MTILVTDLELADRLRREREESDAARHDEVWDGVQVMSPLPNYEHQLLVTLLSHVLLQAVTEEGRGVVLSGFNISDRVEGWRDNYREPDVLVILDGNPGTNHGTHFQGGPDFVVEVLSPNDRAREKLAFYDRIGVREFLVVDRDPWALEIHRRDEGILRLAEHVRLEEVASGTVRSDVLGLTFRLVADHGRPRIEVATLDGHRTWRA